MATLTDNISGLRTQRKRVDDLRVQDNLDALIELGKMEPSVPDGLGALIRVIVSAILKLIGVGVLLAALAIFVYFLGVISQLFLQPTFLGQAQFWLIACAVWSLLLIRGFAALQKPLNFKTLGPTADDALPWWVRALFLPGQTIAWLLVLLVLLVAMAAFWVGVLIGVQFGWQWVLANVPLLPLRRWIPLTPLQINYAISGLIIVVVTSVLYYKKAGFWLFLLWGAGVAVLVQQYAQARTWFMVKSVMNIEAALSGRLDFTPTNYLVVAEGVAIGLSLVLPLGIAIWFANGFRNLWLHWQNRFIWMVQVWRLRRRLQVALSAQRKRHQRVVAGDGKHAVCKEHLTFFVLNQSGSAQYFCCPTCKTNADANAYTNVDRIEGWLDRNMTALHDQHDGALRQNLYEWIDDKVPSLLPMQLVVIDKLDDSHDTEKLAVKYQELKQKDKRFGSVDVKILTSDLDDHARRLVERRLRDK